MAKIELGDLFEIETAKGKSYLQYGSRNDDGIELIRVLRGLYSVRPKSFKELVNEKEQYLVHFPLAAAYRKKLICLVNNFPLPKDFAIPQFMRTTYVRQGEFLGWHIVNIETLQRQFVKELSVSQKQLSPWGVWNDTLLKEKLEEGWSLENWMSRSY
jgi:hypothetical protein